jgi:hypothetical protein
MLDAKWDRKNSTVNVQQVPDFEPLLAHQMPSGGEYHAAEPWNPPVLDTGTLVQMRTALKPEDRTFKGNKDNSGDEDSYRGVTTGTGEPVEAFPVTAADYRRSKTSNSYY